MTKLENISYPDAYICNISMLNELKDDLNTEIDHCNFYAERYEALLSRSLQPPEYDELTDEIRSTEARLNETLFVIRDRIKMIEAPEMIRLCPEYVQEFMKNQLDPMYEKCKSLKDLLN